jgi:membrane fusion protein, heavy metal efflux system
MEEIKMWKWSKYQSQNYDCSQKLFKQRLEFLDPSMICAVGVSSATIMNPNFCAKSIAVLSLLSLWVSFSPAASSQGGHNHGASLGGKGKTGSSEVTIDAATAQSLGIKVAPVQRQKLPIEIVATGQIELLPNQKVEITSPIKGKILQLLVQPGAKVKAGQAVATMTSPELGDLRVASQEKKNEAAASLQQAQAEFQLAQEGYRRIDQIAKADREQALSQLAAAQSRLSREQQLVKSGALVQVAKTNYQRQQQISKTEIDAAQYAVNFASARYQQDIKLANSGAVTRRQALESQARLAEARATLAKALNQPGLIQAETELRKAENDLPLRELREAEKQVAEARGQLAKAVNQRSLIEADSQLRKAKFAILAAQNRPALSSPTYHSRIGQLGNIDNQNGVITVKSPIDGTVAVRAASPEENQDITTGQSVPEAGAKIMTITDDRQVLATINIYEKDLARVKTGQDATVKVGNEVFNGTVSRIGTAVEGQSRVIPVQVAISNSGDSLKSGMYAELRLVTDESTAPAIAVPSASVIEAEGKKIVYVQNDNTYQAVNVQLGQTVGDLVEVKSGLFAGDQVVTQRAMQIYAQSLKAPVHNHGYGEGAKTSAPGGWKMPSPWWLAIPGTLVTGGAWWLMKKRQDNYIDVEEALQVEMMTENSKHSNIYDFDAEARSQTDIQTEVTDVEITDIEEIIESNGNDHTEKNTEHNIADNNHELNGRDRVLITPVSRSN